MKLTSFIAASICVLGILTSCTCPDLSPPREESSVAKRSPKQNTPKGPPNIVLFSIDTLRADHLGVYGYSKKTSPHIDGFAKDAIRFKRAISQAPSTAPGHMSIFTGLMPLVHRVSNFKDDGSADSLSTKIPTLIESLQEHGYFTFGFMGGGNVDASLGFDRGFLLYTRELTSYNWIKMHRSSKDLRGVRHAIEMSNERERPFFLFLHHYVCHSPYMSAPKEYRKRFLEGKRVKGLPEGISDDAMFKFAEEFDRIPSKWTKRQVLFKIFGQRAQHFWRDVDLGQADQNAHIQALYDSGVAYSDYLFNKVTEVLKEHGVYENTIIVLLSDHGEEFFEHGGKEHGRLFIEHLHVPLIIKFPNSAKVESRVVEESVRTIDVLPTIFDYLKLPVGHPIQGESFMPLVTGKGKYAPEMISYTGSNRKTIRLEKEGLAYIEEGFFSNEWLFDTVKDTGEKSNLAAVLPEKLAKMREAAKARKEKDILFSKKLRTGKNRNPQSSKQLIEQLKQLGYVK
ncbi:MAG: sulfatase-like hydrolase/transferase [Deltaproteobacteria bacterium]|nr:sulfatase-like hydrolase/transferase [Deltaproteobacteria bacterium]